MGSVPVANPSPTRKLRFSRRAALLAVVLLACISAVLVAIAFSWPADPVEPNYEWLSLTNATNLPINQPVLIKNRRLYLVRLENNDVLALSRRSTHLGCTVPWRSDFEFHGRKGWFRDPCSGSTWAVDGSVAFGPAARDMDWYPVATVRGDVIVDVRNKLCAPASKGTTYSPCLPVDQYRGTPPR